jgi:hypothetical protein
MLSSKTNKIIVFLFFLAFLVIGLFIVDDYGVSTDEGAVRDREEEVYDFVMAENDLVYYHYTYHGTAFGLPLVVIEKALKLDDSRDVLLLRHFATFLLFYLATIFFYLICKNRFKSRGIGLLGVLFLILSPRIFAHSFYNIKDLVFLSFFIISIYTLTKYLGSNKILPIIVHAIVCGILIDIRAVGLIVPFFTFIFFIYKYAYLFSKSSNKKYNLLINFVIYSFALSFFVVLFWPILWENPGHILVVFEKLAHYPWPGQSLYLGQYYKGFEIPWHYSIVWISITTPVVYLITFLFGTFDVVKNIFKKTSLKLSSAERDDILFLLWFFMPLVMVIALHSSLYSGWRQLFFVYPALILLSLKGILFINEKLERQFAKKYKVSLLLLVIPIALSLISSAIFTVKNHPHQFVYFNPIGTKIIKDLESKFELDYWGLSYRSALEYILANDTSDNINIYVSFTPSGELNAYIIEKTERNRLNYVYDINQADYSLDNYRYNLNPDVCHNIFYTIKVQNNDIMKVCKLN